MKKLMIMGAFLQLACGLDSHSMAIPQHITQQHLELANSGDSFELLGKQCSIHALGMEPFCLGGRTLVQSVLDIRRMSRPDMIPLLLTFVDGTTESATLFITLVQVTQSRKRHADWDPDADDVTFKKFKR